MTKKTNRLKYQPPQARDLTANSASGGQACAPGVGVTTGNCRTGTAPAGQCSPTGISADGGYCAPGGDAQGQCLSGSIHT